MIGGFLDLQRGTAVYVQGSPSGFKAAGIHACISELNTFSPVDQEAVPVPARSKKQCPLPFSLALISHGMGSGIPSIKITHQIYASRLWSKYFEGYFLSRHASRFLIVPSCPHEIV